MKWANWVEETGEDDPEKAADPVAGLMSNGAAETSGCFLWIEDGLQSPILNWGEPGELQPLRE